MEYNYVYLDKIYKDNNGDLKAFQVTKSDKSFQNISTVIVAPEEFIQLSNNVKIQKDFSLEDGYLKCCSKPNVKFTPSIESSIGRELLKVSEEPDFLSFLENGVTNNFIVLDDSLIELERYKGTAFADFNSARFSRSTMSVYFDIVNNGEEYKKIVIYMSDGSLKFSGFYFGVPAQSNITFENEIKTISINNRDYKVYHIEECNIYPKWFSTSASLINKACTLEVTQRSTINILEDFKKELNRVFPGNEPGKNVYTGSGKSLQSCWDVTFESSLKAPSKSARSVILASAFEEFLKKYSSYEEASKSIIESEKFNLATRACMNTILFLNYNFSGTDVLVATDELLKNLRLKQLYTNIFLYRSRIGSYLQNILLTPPDKPYLEGSEYDTFTKVVRGVPYGQSSDLRRLEIL